MPFETQYFFLPGYFIKQVFMISGDSYFQIFTLIIIIVSVFRVL